MSIKALFLDLDGTLLNSQKEITAGNRDAIERALAVGHKVIITTGRPLISAITQAQRLGLTGRGCYLIAYNGGILYDMEQQKPIYNLSIPRKLVFEIFDEANRRGIHIQTYDETKVVVEPRNDTDTVVRYCRAILMEHRVIEDIRALEEDPVKMLLIDFNGRERVALLGEWIRERYAGQLDCFFSNDFYMEIVPAGLNKGSAITHMAQLLEIPMENTIAVGDEANDLEMIEAAGLGAAMRNGVPAAHEIADYITEADNNHDGIAEVIEKFML